MSQDQDKPQEDVLKSIARLWVLDAREVTGLNVPGTSLQDLIDALPDHNQLMIDSIKAVSPALDVVLSELMSYETHPEQGDQTAADRAYTAWTALVSHLFELCRVELAS